MIYGLFIQDSPLQGESFHHALRFSRALLRRGHRIRQIFLYNDAVLAFNDRAGQFPANLVARVLGFAQAAMLESTESPEERKAVRVQF